jgi:hypothetical protein
VAQEALTSGPWVGPALVGLADGSIDQAEVGNGGVLLQDLRVDERPEDDCDALGRLGSEHDLHGDDRAIDARRGAPWFQCGSKLKETHPIEPDESLANCGIPTKRDPWVSHS